MNHQQPSPDESRGELSAQAQRMEQRLQQLQPAPMTLRATDILRAAQDSEQQPQPARTVADNREHVRKTSRWAAIGASWICGALAGSLLTMAILQRNAASDVPARNQSPAPNATVDRGSETVPSTQQSPALPNAIAQKDAHRLASEQRTTQHSLALRSLTDWLGKSAPLRAGSYVNLSNSISPWDAQMTLPERHEVRIDTAPTPIRRAIEPIRAGPSATKQRLLQEALGNSSGGFL